MTRARRARVLLRAAISAAALVLVASCSFQKPTSDVPASYDFGPAPTYTRSNPGIPGTVLVTRVRAPMWLEDTGIVYRLLYEDASQPRVYAMSRWSAEPASLLSDRLFARLAASAKGVVSPGYSAHSDYTMRVELEDFSQHFSAPNESRAVLKARASLLATDARRLLAQREFEVVRPAAANAPGAVKALTDASNAFVDDLVKWTEENVRAAGSAATEPAGK